MLGASPFYFGLIRKYIVLFGTLFNDIKIIRDDTTHNVSQTIDIPLTYGPREKVLARLEGDPNLNKMPAIQLPRMTFELDSFAYDAARKMVSTGRNVIGTGNSNVTYQYNPVPYDFNFNFSVIAKNVDDGLRIVEQILPYFTPALSLKAILIPAMNDIRDITVVLNSTTYTDSYAGNFEERRFVTWDFAFTLHGFLFGPTHTGGVITLANTSFFDASLFTNTDDAIGSNTRIETLTVVPGQLANGSATSNAAATIDRSLIAANSTYGYITTSNTAP